MDSIKSGSNAFTRAESAIFPSTINKGAVLFIVVTHIILVALPESFEAVKSEACAFAFNAAKAITAIVIHAFI